jgi:hypothetical protein
MRVAWKEYGDRDPSWLARIGPCSIAIREMQWHDPLAQEHRQAIVDGTAWRYSIRNYPHEDDMTRSEVLAEGVIVVEQRRYEGGLRLAQARAVEMAREIAACKRVRRERDALEPESVIWLEHRLLETLRVSYTRWREMNARYGKGTYPEPRWWTALLAGEAAQYHRPDDLQIPNKRFYSIVRTTLERLRRRGLVASSTGADDQGRETTLWEPV